MLKIYCEKASGAQPERRELLRLLKAVAPGDVVTVTRIDRPARSTFDLFAELGGIATRRATKGNRCHRRLDRWGRSLVDLIAHLAGTFRLRLAIGPSAYSSAGLRPSLLRI